MPEYKVYPKLEKAVLEQFGLTKVKYKIYNSIVQDAEQTGLRLPLAGAIQAGLSQVYKPGIASITANHEGKTAGEGDMFDGNTYHSKDFGTPEFPSLVFSSLRFSDTTDFFDEKNTLKMMPDRIDTCLFTVNQQKNIVKTAIQGRNGTIKEYIGDGDYTINIKGIITGSNGKYPYKQVKNLIEFLKQPTELKVEVPYLNEIHGITQIVIENYDFPQDAGSYSQQVFNINCVSDYELVANLFNFEKNIASF